MSNKKIFALDIGTRNIIGVVAELEEDSVKVKAQHMVEHSCRAMYDGQIHDIPRVASEVAKLKATLEQTLGYRLDKVAIAAAGRALITKRAQVELETDRSEEVDGALVHSLNMAGLHQAHQALEQEVEGSGAFICVGYSTIGYYLNNYPIINLIGHRGSTIGTELLATFLPDSVINSLYAVLERVGLEPVSLTLEPIAAIDITIPAEIRTLNLALVDVGAGTSDIAITNDGSTTAYGMVPLAGDEISEVIVKEFLVDFNTAETIKRQLNQQTITYTDILGLENTLPSADIITVVEPVVEKLASEIVRVILQLNGGKSPKTIFCIGGGAQIPLLSEKIAQGLELPQSRVAVRGRDILRQLVNVEQDDIDGPEGVTVLGIASVALKKSGYDFITVTINGYEHSLFNNNHLTVADALGMAAYNLRHLLAVNGGNLTFKLNGQDKTIYGQLGTPAKITINDQLANLQTPVKDRDVLVINQAVAGADAQIKIEELVSSQGLQWDHCNVTVNERHCTPTDIVKNGDEIEITNKLMATQETPKDSPSTTPPKVQKWVTVMVNNEAVTLQDVKNPIFLDIFNFVQLDLARAKGSVVLKCNGENVVYTQPIADGDVIEVYWPKNP